MGRMYINDWKGLAATARYDVNELAKLCQRSVRQLQRDFRRQFACAPQTWLNEERLKAARSLLLSGQPIKTVAWELGFKQSSHFCRQFKTYHKLTPSQFIDVNFNGVMSSADNMCR